MDKYTQLLLRLVRSVLTDTAFEVDEPLDEETIDILYKLAKRHELAPLAAEGLMRAGVRLSGDAGAKFKRQRMAAIFSDETKNAACIRLRDILNAERVEHIFLKGFVLRNYYPEPWLRTRCDIDVLVRREQLDMACKALAEAGYTRGKEGAHDITFQTPEGVPLELHFVLVSDEENVKIDSLEHVWDYAAPIHDGSFCYEMDDAMFYCYHLSHIAKHLRVSGCGLRLFIDLWLLDHLPDIDTEKRRKLLEDGGLVRFAQVASSLAESWMTDRPYQDDIHAELADFVISSNVHGALKQVAVNRKHGPLLTFFFGLFHPYRVLARSYPILRKYPILYPFCTVARWFQIIFREKKGFEKLVIWKKGSKLYKENHSDAKKMMEDLGLL